MTAPRAILFVLTAAAAAGCAASRPNLTTAQLDAIQTRQIDAPPDVAFRAAAGVMLDRGMMITLSDGGAGLIGARAWMDAPQSHAQNAPDSPYATTQVVAWVRPSAAGHSLLRVQFGRGGLTAADAEVVSRFAEDVARRTLVAAPKGSMR